MTLNQIEWIIFDVDPAPQLEEYVTKLQRLATASSDGEVPTSPTASIDQSTIIKRRGGRLNTKLRAQTTVQEFGSDMQHVDTFWERNFQSEDEVPWYKFQKSFLDDYETQLSSMLKEGEEGLHSAEGGVWELSLAGKQL